jgi:repressor LexA
MISALEDRGFIRRLANKARALEVIKLPQNVTPTAPVETPVNKSNKVFSIPGISGTHDIPLVGRIAAGTPIEALQDTSNLITVPQHMISSNKNHYALEVRGDSMINVGIHDGDIAIIHSADSAQNGEIVVALVEDCEATLKRFQKRGSAIVLEPANPAYETMLYDSSQVKIQGKLVGILRTYLGV